MKTVKVLLSEKLPPMDSRDPEVIYFTYDKLNVYLGQNKYYDNYAVVEKLPDEPVTGMLYFDLSDGYAKSYIEYQWNNVAKIEDNDQLEILKQSGTTFFVNADRRYLDLQRRTIILPFNNGTYELTVGLANELIFDENTIIKFNPESGRFEIYGKHDDLGMVFLNHYAAKHTPSINMDVENHKISGNVMISQLYDNLIELMPDGLYAGDSKFVPTYLLDNWIKNFKEYKESMDKYLKELDLKTQGVGNNIKESTINEKISEAVKNAMPEMDKIIQDYDNYKSNIDRIEKEAKKYTDDAIDKAYEEIYDDIFSIENEWEDF